MIYSSWDIECDRLKLVIMGHFLPLHPPLKTKKITILKKWKELLEISSIYISVPKPQLYEAWFLRYRVRQTEFFAILDHFFALLPHYWQKIKIWKKCKENSWRYYPFTHVYHKWRSYDLWLLRYKVWLTEFFCHLGPFLALWPF